MSDELVEINVINEDLVFTGDIEFDEILKNNVSKQVILKNGYTITNIRFVGSNQAQDKLDEIFLIRLKNGVNINKYLCWISKEALRATVDIFISGSIRFNIMSVVPFLEKEELKKLATKVIDEDGFNGLRFNSLIPFLDKFFIKKIVKDFIDN